MAVHWSVWVGFIAAIVVLLVLDLVVIHRKPHAVSTREAAIWTAIWVGLGLAFGCGLWLFAGTKHALEYFAGYLLEKGLSVDNLFVFIMIFRRFGVPNRLQHRVLFWGILGAVLLRGLFIWAGVALISRFGWVLWLFGAFLIYTGGKLLVGPKQAQEPERAQAPKQSRIMRWTRRAIPSTADFRDSHFFVHEDGRWLATPLLFVLITVEFTDVIFATDSIPAIFGVTQDPFIIFTSNVLAILGLRALYFLLADVVERFRYLHVGLSMALIFIGSKMLLEHYVHIPVLVSLLTILGIFVLAIVASIVRDRIDHPNESSKHRNN